MSFLLGIAVGVALTSIVGALIFRRERKIERARVHAATFLVKAGYNAKPTSDIRVQRDEVSFKVNINGKFHAVIVKGSDVRLESWVD